MSEKNRREGHGLPGFLYSAFISLELAHQQQHEQHEQDQT
jgi:hypothetical protein